MLLDLALLLLQLLLRLLVLGILVLHVVSNRVTTNATGYAAESRPRPRLLDRRTNECTTSRADRGSAQRSLFARGQWLATASGHNEHRGQSNSRKIRTNIHEKRAFHTDM